MNYTTRLTRLQGVGDKVAEKLAILGLETVNDLLYYYPRRYEDFSHPRTIDQLIPDHTQIIKARIVSIENDVTPRQRMKLTKAVVADDTGQIGLVWFNQPFLVRLLKEGTTWLFAGKVERNYQGMVSMVSPVIEREPRIIPVYGETAGLTSKIIRKLLFQLQPMIHQAEDWLPEGVRRHHELVSIGDAWEMIHFPESIEQLSVAKKRLAFDELFFLLMRIQQTRTELATAKAPACPIDNDELKSFVDSLPFELTESQKVASWQIIQDLAETAPMNRLLEGDVGSGKTVVGATAAYAIMKGGHRVVWMAPTEILAKQHFVTCQKFLGETGFKIGLLTGSTPAKERALIPACDLVIGTQAVIQDKVTFDRLGLVIVDEQHRFGVKQRNRLINDNEQLVPHFLAMTATPIPRTLALTIYGDLAISQLQTVPTGRKTIISRLVAPQQRSQAYQFIRQQINEGRQAFVVCPLIEDKSSERGQLSLELEEKKTVMAEYAKLSKTIFPDLKIGLLHGKLKPTEKAEVMEKFRNRELDVLIATAVIEVGIDIPNATVMMIEGADRFGLAQLHQFRGRVGRAEHQSYCFVFTDSQNPASIERLKAFTETTSGFDLAELDLELRGPGQLAGLVQSGLSDLKLASLSDISLIQQAKSAVSAIIEDGVGKYPALKEQISSRSIAHLA